MVSIDHTDSRESLLQMRGIIKDFPGIRALDGVDFDVRPGEVHALIGENGAGKSTLMNVLAGRFADYQGDISISGEHVHFTSPHAALEFGVAVIYQDLSVLENFTVAQNIMLGEEKTLPWTGILDREAIDTKASEIIHYLGFDLDPRQLVGDLSRARQCLVEIAAAVRRNARLLVFDEPTASLGGEDVEKLFRVIKQLRSRDLGIVYISHRIAELPRIADRVTVLRDGSVVGTRDMADCTLPELTRMMLGHELAEVFPPRTNKPGKTILKVEGLTRPGVFQDISFELREGEILGIAGLVGSGRTEIARAIFGADKARGTIRFHGKALKRSRPEKCRKLGIAMVPENRKIEGSITGRSIAENLNISILEKLSEPLGFQSPPKLADRAMQMVDRMRIEPPDTQMNIENLSGGNQQKVIVGRWLAAESKIIIFDEPTQGIDVGTKSQMYKLIMDLACAGRAVILISSELLEIAELADRILIVREGRIVKQIKGGDIDEDGLFTECVGKEVVA